VRLGALLLSPAALTAQVPLPWDNALELPWETTLPGPLPAPWEAAPAAPGPRLRVSLSGDGTLHIADNQGRVSLRLGLPGRPLHLLRDGGTPLSLADFPCFFPVDTPLTKGLGSFPLSEGDFRNALQGLLWIVDDGERRITVVHPATQRVVYLPLPAGENWEVCLFPDRLEVRERAVPGEVRREMACWSLSWLILLPQFVRLGLPPPVGIPGTAFRPFPQE
jgi:hypothetical protein